MSGTHESGKGRSDVPAANVPGRQTQRAPLSKRFYTAVAVSPRDGAFAVLLDGRPIRTPGKRLLALPSRALADAVAEEWASQREVVAPSTMPLTRIVNSAIDAVAGHMAAVAADIAAFAGSDLVCYRAEAPEDLAQRQKSLWDPVVAWAEQAFGTRISLAAGVMPIEQSPELGKRINDKLAGLDPIRLAALHVMTTLTGSALIALAHGAGVLGRDAAWSAAHVDEDWQIANWGEDEEAQERRTYRGAEFAAASRLLALLAEVAEGGNGPA